MVDPLSEHAIAPSGMNPAWVGLDQFAEEHPEAIDPSATAIFTPEDFESASHHYSDPRLDVDAPGQADAPKYEASGRTPPSGQASTGPQGRPESALTPAEPDSEQRAGADDAARLPQAADDECSPQGRQPHHASRGSSPYRRGHGSQKEQHEQVPG